MADLPIQDPVSRETSDRLSVYAQLLAKWTRKINLIAPSTVDQVFERHIADSAQLFDLAPPDAGTWLDLGSGGGLPGAVIAILAAELRPGLRMTCVESDQRKAVFLGVVSRETGVAFEVRAERIEALPSLAADVLSARALTSLDRLLGYAAVHLSPGGVALFPKGARHHNELLEAQKNWRFDHETTTSRTDPNAIIYKVGAPHRV